MSAQAAGRALQPVAHMALLSTGGASRLAALLLPENRSVFLVVAPGQPGAAPVDVQRGTSTVDCERRLILAEAAATDNCPARTSRYGTGCRRPRSRMHVTRRASRQVGAAFPG